VAKVARKSNLSPGTPSDDAYGDLGGFAKVPHTITADPRLSDSAFRLLIALESWAWQKSDCYPSNRQIAERAGWVSSDGTPSVSKVKRVIRDLEQLGYINRVVFRDGMMVSRSKIKILRSWRDLGDGSKMTHSIAPEHDAQGWVKNNPGGGSELTHPGSKMTHSEEPSQEDSFSLEESFRQPPSSSSADEITLSPVPDQRQTASDIEADPDRPEDDPKVLRKLSDVYGRLDAMPKPPRSRKGHVRNVQAFANAASQLLLDDHSFERYLKLGWAVVNGRHTPEVVKEAFDQVYHGAGRRGIDNLGAYFFRTIEGMEANAAHVEVERDLQGESAPPNRPARAVANGRG
jgi:hypothetical protein